MFVAGLMVGRTPEFLGKKIEKAEIILVSLTLVIHPLVILAPTGMIDGRALRTSFDQKPYIHGYSEVLYAFTTSAANNGSAFAGPEANTPWYNLGTALGHSHWPLSADYLYDGGGGFCSAQVHHPGHNRHLAHGYFSSECSGWARSSRRGANFLPGACAWTDREFFAMQRGPSF